MGIHKQAGKSFIILAIYIYVSIGTHTSGRIVSQCERVRVGLCIAYHCTLFRVSMKPFFIYIYVSNQISGLCLPARRLLAHLLILSNDLSPCESGILTYIVLCIVLYICV